MKHKLLGVTLIIFILIELLLAGINLTYFNYLKSIIWSIVTVLLIFISIYFSFKLKFPQLKLKKIFKSLFKKTTGEISSFESLSISLAAKIGVGSLSGIALSIYIGGIGSIFWMWVITLISGIISYIEGYLGVLYQEKNKNKELIGGPSFYIKRITNSKFLAILYSILIIISYIFGFITIQSNTIVKSVNYIFDINKYVILIIIVILTSLIIFKGIKKIAKFSSKIVPIMGLIYIVLGVYIIITNINYIPNIIINIVKTAINFKSFFGGFLTAIITGIQRGIFATEVGVGTSAISSSLTSDTPQNQGYVHLFGNYFTSFVICTITAFIIISAKVDTSSYSNINGIEYVIDAFVYHLGNLGVTMFLIITILFAFSTIVSGYCFGELSLEFIYKKISKRSINLFKTLTIILVFVGGIISPNILWNLIDVLIAILTIINIYSIYLLKNKIK